MLSRRRFFGAVAGAAVAAPVAVAAAPELTSGFAISRRFFATVDPRPMSPKLGDTIMIKTPIRFVQRESYNFTWSLDEIVPVTMATVDELEAFHADERRRAGLNF